MSNFRTLNFQKKSMNKLTESFLKLWNRPEPQRHSIWMTCFALGMILSVSASKEETEEDILHETI